MKSTPLIDVAVIGDRWASFRSSLWPVFFASALLITVWAVGMISTYRHPELVRLSGPFATYVVVPLAVFNACTFAFCRAPALNMSAGVLLVAWFPWR